MIVETGYETGSDPATGLTNYMGRDDHDLRDHAGRDLDDDEIQEFNEKAAENGFSRQIILAPERGDLSEKELDRAARKTMNEWTADHNTTEYLYSVHEDTDHPHVHVAATATQDSQDLWMDSEDIDQLRDQTAADHFQDHTTEQQQEMMIEQGREDELRQEQQERQLADLDQQEQDQGDEIGLALSAASQLSETSAEMAPAKYLLEAYREEKRDRERQQQQQNHKRQRDRR